jgi:predicted PurR-regulated permease PerM
MTNQSSKHGNQQEPQDDSLFEWRGRNVLRVWIAFFLVVFFILFLLLLWKAVPVLLLMFAGSLIALALRYLSDAFSRITRIPPLWSLTIVLVVLIAGSVVGGYLAFPTIAEQTRELGENLRESLTDLEDRMRDTKTGSYLIGQIEGIGEEAEGNGAIWPRLAGLFTTTFTAIAGFFLTLTIGIFFAYNPRMYVCGFLRLVPLAKRKRTCQVISQLGFTLRWWMVGQLISMAVLAVTTWLMLWLLGVPLGFILGLLTGLLTFVPYLGPIIAAIPILLIAFVESPQLALYVLILYLIIQNAEANVLMPIIFQKTVHLPPVLTIVAQILLGAIFGLVGVILATPLMAAGITIIKMVYVEDVLGDSMDRPVPQEPEPVKQE